MNNLIKQLLSGDGWTETKGFSSMDGIICPYCPHLYAQPKPIAPLAPFRFTCIACKKTFEVRVVKLPVGLGWMSQAEPVPVNLNGVAP
jgi:hypothetical protein